MIHSIHIYCIYHKIQSNRHLSIPCAILSPRIGPSPITAQRLSIAFILTSLRPSLDLHVTELLFMSSRYKLQSLTLQQNHLAVSHTTYLKQPGPLQHLMVSKVPEVVVELETLEEPQRKWYSCQSQYFFLPTKQQALLLNLHFQQGSALCSCN